MCKWRTGLVALVAAGLFFAGCGRSDVDDPTPPRPRAGPVDPATGMRTAVAAPAEDDGSGGGGGGGGGGGESPVAASALPALPPVLKVVQPGVDGKLPEVIWDLREERSPSKVGWPKDSGGNKVFALDGDFQFSIKVHDDKDFDGRVRHVESRRSGGLIESVEITGQAQSTQAAYEQAKGLLGKLGFGKDELAKLDAWYTKAKAGNYDNLDMTVKNSYDRMYTVHVVNDGTSELPWSVGVDIDWSKVCGCHG